MDTLYLFLDESGNLSFNTNSTKYLIISCLSTVNPFEMKVPMDVLRYSLLNQDLDLEEFHAAKDKPNISRLVFDILADTNYRYKIDSIIVEKAKTIPHLQSPEMIYPMIVKYLIRYILNRHDISSYERICIFTDVIQIKKKRNAIEGAIKSIIENILKGKIPYSVFHHDSKSNYYLQAIDYCTWAIARKWSTGDSSHYDKIRSRIMSEFDIFQKGTKYYY